MKDSKLLTTVSAITMALLLCVGAILVPILCRPFYYAHIQPLKLSEQTGLTVTDIKRAYNEMLDYCLGLDEFATGTLPWSESGKAHFFDVQQLFFLAFRLFGLCVVVLFLLWLLSRFLHLRPALLLGHGPCFWSGAGLGILFLLVGGLASLDFHGAFVFFHTLFFPGKDNWILNSKTDPIIDILPQIFFRNCAILILALIIIGCIFLMLVDIISINHRRRAI